MTDVGRRTVSIVATATLLLPHLEGASSVSAQPLVGCVHVHVVEEGESLATIAAAHAMRVNDLAALNERRPDAPLRHGTSLHVDDRHLAPSALADGIVINVAQRMLYLAGHGQVLLAFPIAAGRPDWRTPRGTFRVVEREVDPAWDVPVSIREELTRQGKAAPLRVPPGPANPLGVRWLRLDAPGIGIHGTNAPASIYQLVTHGCIRLQNAHVRVLYEHVSVGTAVTIVYEPVLAASADGAWWLEVHPDRYRLAGRLEAAALTRLEALGLVLDAAVRARVSRVVARAAGRPEQVAVLDQPAHGRGGATGAPLR